MEISRLAVQTWTVQEQMKANPESTLLKIKSIGFRDLELAGSAGRAPEEFSRICRKLGFTVVGVHQPPLDKTNLQDLLQEIRRHCKAFGAKYATVMLDPAQSTSREAYQSYARLCSEAGKDLSADEITLCHHCYHFDLRPLGDDNSRCGLDILYDEVSDTFLTFELDTFFVFKARVPYESVIQKYGSRCRLVHLCDIDDDAKRISVGDGRIPWEKFLRDVQAHCPVEWFIVEDHAKEPLASIRRSFLFLRQHLAFV